MVVFVHAPICALVYTFVHNLLTIHVTSDVGMTWKYLSDITF